MRNGTSGAMGDHTLLVLHGGAKDGYFAAGDSYPRRGPTRAGEITKAARGYQLGREPGTIDETTAESSEAERAAVPGVDAEPGESGS